MAAPLLGAACLVLSALSPTVLGDEDCIGYHDPGGYWRPKFDCRFGTFCCGNCEHRYCCIDPMKLITERMQKSCLFISSPKTIAGIGFAVVLFFVVIVTLICCFMCSCCYLYKRRHQRGTPYFVQETQMSGISQQPPYPTQPSYPTQPTYPMQPAYPMQPPYPMQSPYPPQPPYPMDPKFAPPPPGYEPVPVYQPSGPTPQYPMYPPGPPMYNPNVAPPNTMYPGV
ncbi:protein shisa-4 isoform X2 [Phyllobates terribilis]|uniref:protein shisa-4 isoform X2 n=1 Tax=Phyllobates terribilis TaxID=111132 RepID=UPI003CCAEF92